MPRIAKIEKHRWPVVPDESYQNDKCLGGCNSVAHVDQCIILFVTMGLTCMMESNLYGQ